MKALRPSMKEKKRYLVLKGKFKLSKTEIEKAILDFIGVLGMSKAGLEFIKINKDLAIISVNRQSVDEVRASLSVWPKKITVTKVSGTLKGLK